MRKQSDFISSNGLARVSQRLRFLRRRFEAHSWPDHRADHQTGYYVQGAPTNTFNHPASRSVCHMKRANGITKVARRESMGFC